MYYAHHPGKDLSSANAHTLTRYAPNTDGRGSVWVNPVWFYIDVWSLLIYMVIRVIASHDNSLMGTLLRFN